MYAVAVFRGTDAMGFTVVLHTFFGIVHFCWGLFPVITGLDLIRIIIKKDYSTEQGYHGEFRRQNYLGLGHRHTTFWLCGSEPWLPLLLCSFNDRNLLPAVEKAEVDHVLFLWCLR